MQVPSSEEAAAENPKEPEVSEATNSNVEDEEADATADDESSVIDISRRNLNFSIPESSEDAAALYLYKNVFNLLPKSIGSHKRLRTLRFFGNEINIFSPLASSEFGSFVGLECLQVRISSPEFGGLPLNKLKGLKELELSKGPPRPSACQIFSEIAGLKCLTKLSVSYFCISYLPVEIGCLNNLEYLDLSFNLMKTLPAELGNLSSLISLKVANNLLVVLPSTLSSLQRLEDLDLSYNRLTSLGSLELDLMHNLQSLNLQHNKILTFCQIPSWICCNLEGNEKDTLNDEFSSSSVEMDVYETPIQESEVNISCRGFHYSSTSQVDGHSSKNRCCAARRTGRYRKQGNNLQQRARQERLNSSRKKGLDPSKLLHVKKDEECKPGNTDLLVTESYPECASDIINLDDDGGDKELISRELQTGNVHEDVRPDVSLKEVYVGNCSSVSLESSTIEKGDEKGFCEFDASSAPSQEVSGKEDESSSSNISKSTSNPKRHFDGDGDNLRHPKCRRFRPDSSNLSRKYSDFSLCGMDDHLVDGFYDAGRDRPFMPLEVYEQNFHLDSREVIVVDRQWDKELDTILCSAKDLVSRLNTHWNKADELQIASMLALFVSDHFGGSDRSALIEWARKANPLSDYEKPFVCTCPIQNNLSTKPLAKIVEDVVFSDLCDKSLHSIKERQNSIVVPIGTLQFGVCRHRALLLKYLCDWVEPRVPCELVRGYLDFMPHAWNVILNKRDGKEIRMVVDACRPRDIREETNPEYYCRYIPLSRTEVSIPIRSIPTSASFPSMSSRGKTLKKPVTSLIRRKYGSNDAAGKMRTLVARGSSVDEIRNFDYSCLGEIRILSALKHPCVVQMYGHEILSKWVSSVDGSHEHRILQSIIWMEDIKGGSLLSYIKKLSKAGEKHVPVQLALCIAKDVACALVELHSKHIIHRDVKSENILIDLDGKTANGTPVVKLCDFDRAVPLRSYLHTCCIRHIGIPHCDICVGTPSWMAPEVLRAMHERNIYGLEIDIWSFGCLLLELLTLQIPYAGLPHLEIHELLAMGKRPKLTDELEAFRSVNEPVMTQAGSELEGTEADLETLKFLVDLFYQCTEENPENRPTADNLYELLLNYRNAPATSRTKKY